MITETAPAGQDPFIPDSPRMKIAFVCQRYGLEVNGGAELLCRQIAEHLAAFFDVTVYTTCAVDYVTWANEYPEGAEDLNGVHVLRFPVDRERNPKQFDYLSRMLFHLPFRPSPLEEKWITLQGPFCPKLMNVLKQDHLQFKAVLYMTYLYYTTINGINSWPENALLIPTVHDEPPASLHCFDAVFGNARGFVWNSPEERSFALKRFPQIAGKPEVIGGAGIDIPAFPLTDLPEQMNMSFTRAALTPTRAAAGCLIISRGTSEST